MNENLVELAQRFVRLSGELDLDPRRHEAATAERGCRKARRPFCPSQAARRKAAAIQPPEGASGGKGRRDDPQAPAVVAGNANGGDRQGDGGAKVDDRRAAEAPSGEGPGRARRRRVASAGLTAEEIADLLKPGPAAQCERWVKPLTRCEATSSARFG